jgi:glycine cleavage system H protein
MKKCPYLEEIVVRYCKAYPVKKLIPSSSSDVLSLCLSDAHVNCPEYRKMAKIGQKVSFVEGFALIENLHYHPRHNWVELTKDGTLRVGLDDFAQKLLGDVTEVNLPVKGEIVKERKFILNIKCGRRSTKLRSPIAGKITDINKKLEEEPSLLKKDPYGSWLFALEPFDLETSLQKLLIGDDVKWWLEMEAERLRHKIERDIGVTVADGGALVNTVEELDKNEWKDLVEDFLLT